MKRFILITVLVIASIFTSNMAVASHLLGGEITWECVASGPDKGKYVFLLRLYRACYQGAAGLGTTASISNPLYANYGGISTIPLTEEYVNDLSKPCFNPSMQLLCGVPIGLGGNSAVEEHVYLSQPVKLIGTPDANGSEFHWASCCRPTTMNLNGSGYYLRAVMFPYINPISNMPQPLGSANTASCFDSSPKFLSKPAVAACTKQLTNYDHAIFDINGDSIVYDWASPMQAATVPVAWKPGYNDTLQLPNFNHDTLNVGPFLDKITGNVTFNTDSPAGGYHSISIKATSYKDGQKVAEIYRDIVISLVNCNTISTVPQLYNYNNPSILIKESSALNYQSTFAGVYPVGSTINLDLRSEDYDLLHSSPISSQSVDLEVIGVSMSTTPNDNLDCLLKPCAYLDSNNVAWDGMNFQDTTDVDVNFTWNTSCSNLEDFSQYTGANSTRNFIFQVKSKDNWCPVPSESVSYFSITLVDTNSTNWPIDSIDASNGGAYVSWPQYSGSNFLSYDVYRSYDPLSPWTFVTSISNIQTSAYVDHNAKSDSTGVFYLIEINNGGGCNLGYEVNSMNLKLDEQVNGINLSWNSPYLNSSFYINGQYEIWKKDSLGPWTLINTISFGTENFLDPSFIYHETIKYKVISTDLYSLYAVSNVANIYVDSVKTKPGFSELNTENVTIYPNPVEDDLFIETGGLTDQFRYSIFSISGGLELNSSNYISVSKIDVSALNEGMYFIQFEDEYGNRHQQKFIKQ